MDAEIYNEQFASTDEIIVPPVFLKGLPTRHLYPLLIKFENLKIERNQFAQLLRQENIGVSVHYVPINYHPYFQRELGLTSKDFPYTSWFYEREISLPIYTKLKKENLIRIAEVIKTIIRKYRSE